MQHHVVAIDKWHLQSSVVACDGAIYHVGNDACTFGIRMDSIREEVGTLVERLKEVEHLHTCTLCHLHDFLVDFVMPVARSALKARMQGSERRHSANHHAALGIDHPESVDQCSIVGDEVIAIVGPVARVGIVDTKMNHDNIGSESLGIGIFLLKDIWPMTLAEQCCSRLAEVAHFIAASQQVLQAHRISLSRSVSKTCAVCDAVAHTCHLDRLTALLLLHSSKREGEDARKTKEYEQETACHDQYRNYIPHSPFRKKNGTPQRRPV